MNEPESTYLVVCGNLKQRGETARAFACLGHVLLGLHSCRIVVVRGVQEGLAQAVHELLRVGVLLRLQNVLGHRSRSVVLVDVNLKEGKSFDYD